MTAPGIGALTALFYTSENPANFANARRLCRPWRAANRARSRMPATSRSAATNASARLALRSGDIGPNPDQIGARAARVGPEADTAGRPSRAGCRGAEACPRSCLRWGGTALPSTRRPRSLDAAAALAARLRHALSPNHPSGGKRSKNVPASLRGSCKTFPLFPSGGTVLRETPRFLAGTWAE